MRSSSPGVKRRMSQMNQDERSLEDVEMDNNNNKPTDNQMDEGDSRPAQRRATSVDMIGADADAEMVDAVDSGTTNKESHSLGTVSLSNFSAFLFFFLLRLTVHACGISLCYFLSSSFLLLT